MDSRLQIGTPGCCFGMKRNIWSTFGFCSVLCGLLYTALMYHNHGIRVSPLPEADSKSTPSPDISAGKIGSSQNISESDAGSKPFLKDYKNPCWKEDRILQCVPYFYTPGFGKSGSTSLFKTIVLHPDIVKPFKKEMNGWGKGLIIDNMLRSLSINQVMSSLSNNTNKNGFHHKITGDGTPRYIWDLRLPKFLYSLFHGTRIIIIMRHPSDRFFSHYSHECRMSGQNQSAQRLHEAVEKTIKSINICARTNSLLRCVIRTKPSDGDYCRGARIRLSVYMAYLTTWLEVFPRDQVLLLEYEQFFSDTVAGSDLIHQFLGLNPADEKLRKKIAHVNQQRNQQAPADNNKYLWPKTRTLLDQFYAPFNRMLADYLHDERFLFRPQNNSHTLIPR